MTQKQPEPQACCVRHEKILPSVQQLLHSLYRVINSS